MRRVILNLLRCPRCLRGGVQPEVDTAEVLFGPVRCPECQASYPVGEGVADFVGDRAPHGAAQKSLERPLVARSYERYIRPAVQLFISRRRFDRDSEYLLYRSLIGDPEGPVLDLGCGTGLFARRLAREAGFPPIVGMDVSKPMLEEAVAQAREAGVRVDFLRAEAPQLPFADQSLGAVLQTGSLHLMDDVARLFVEVARVLRPGGRYVGTSYLPPGFPSSVLHRRAGLYPRGEDELRTAAATAGLHGFQRMLLPPFLLVKAERAKAA